MLKGCRHAWRTGAWVGIYFSLQSVATQWQPLCSTHAGIDLVSESHGETPAQPPGEDEHCACMCYNVLGS